MSTLRTVLIDLDGTLIDSRPGIAASCQAALRALGHAPDPAFDVTPLIGPPMPQVIHRLLVGYGDDRIAEGIAAYRAHYGEVGLHMATVYPGAAEALQSLSQQVRCIVVTSKRKDFAVRIVRAAAFSSAVDAVYGTEPDGSLDDKALLIATVMCAEALAPNETVMVGDRSHDMIGARTNRLPGLGVLWGYGSRDELEAAGADRLIASPDELAAIPRF